VVGATHVYDINQSVDDQEQGTPRMIRFDGRQTSHKIVAIGHGKRHRVDEAGKDRRGKKRLIERTREDHSLNESPTNALSTNSYSSDSGAGRQRQLVALPRQNDHSRPTAATQRSATPHELVFIEQSGNPSSAYCELRAVTSTCCMIFHGVTDTIRFH